MTEVAPAFDELYISSYETRCEHRCVYVHIYIVDCDVAGFRCSYTYTRRANVIIHTVAIVYKSIET